MVEQMKWDEMSSQERRVAIANDVILQIKAGKYKVLAGNGYVSQTYYGDGWQLLKLMSAGREQNRPITKDDVAELAEHCAVCAKGAMFLSRIDQFNQIQWADIGDQSSITDEITVQSLVGAFSEESLQLIEAAFEGWGFEDADITDSILKWRKQFRKAPDRLIAICENIIRNGDFDVADIPATVEPEQEVSACPQS